MSGWINGQSKWDEAVAEEIVRRVSAGEFICNICKESRMPTPPTVRAWRKAHPQFDEAMEAATRNQCEARDAEMLPIADNTEEDAQSRKVRIWARERLNKAVRPDLYSEKLQHLGSTEQPLAFQIITGVPQDGDADD